MMAPQYPRPQAQPARPPPARQTQKPSKAKSGKKPKKAKRGAADYEEIPLESLDVPLLVPHGADQGFAVPDPISDDELRPLSTQSQRTTGHVDSSESVPLRQHRDSDSDDMPQYPTI
jgi:hypothetical protein